MSQNIRGLDDAIRKFKDYIQGNGDFDELDLKEFIVDSLSPSVSQNIREEVTGLLGYAPYTGGESTYEKLWEKAKDIVRKRDKPQYQETLNNLAEEEFNALQLEAILALITKSQVEARIGELERLRQIFMQDHKLGNGDRHLIHDEEVNDDIKDRLAELKDQLKEQ